jgi:hypothetical protein
MNFESMTSKELKALAKDKQIKNWWTMKKLELIEALQNAQDEPQDEEEGFVGTLLPEEESVPESESEASKDDEPVQKKKKLLVASVRNTETNEFEVVRGEYANRNEFYAALREQGYRVRYVSTEENFERDGEKYKKACDKVKSDRKAARAAKKEAEKNETVHD